MSQGTGAEPKSGAGDASEVVDARGTLCPQPVIELARAMAQRPAIGQSVTLLADDPATVHDVPAWCRMRGCMSLVEALDDGSYQYLVTRIEAR